MRSHDKHTINENKAAFKSLPESTQNILNKYIDTLSSVQNEQSIQKSIEHLKASSEQFKLFDKQGNKVDKQQIFDYCVESITLNRAKQSSQKEQGKWQETVEPSSVRGLARNTTLTQAIAARKARDEINGKNTQHITR